MSQLPSLILISPPTFKTGEVDLLCKLFDAGLKRFHLRKPNCKSEELREYLKQVPRKYLPKIVIHRYSELVKEFDLGGYHYRSDEPSSEIFSTSSRSFHKLNELKDMSEKLDYIFFGPVYESISKIGYKPKVPLSKIFSLFKSNEFQESPNKPKIYALGGIRRKKLKRLSEVGFDGVALLGSVWGSRDPVKAFKEFVNFEVGNSVFSNQL